MVVDVFSRFRSRLGSRWLLKVLVGLFGFLTILQYTAFGITTIWRHPTTVAFVEKIPMPDFMNSDISSQRIIVPFEELMKSPLAIKQDDPWLIKKIQRDYMFPPSKEPYNTTTRTQDTSLGQTKHIRQILKDKLNGFFVECGAFDGETRSNTLFLERSRNWQGILIEGNPKNFNLLRYKKRKAWTFKACLSTHTYPNSVMFKDDSSSSRITSLPKGAVSDGYVEVQCLPLYSILLAANATQVDYFSLNVEGDELKVLKTIPWDKVNIKSLSISYIKTPGGKTEIKKFMATMSYNFYREEANDVLFMKSKFSP